MPLDAIVELSRHPASRGTAARRLVAEVRWCAHARELSLRYRLEADAERLLVPPAAPPARADGLWRHTCFEAFVQPAGQAGYLEFNLAPSGEWAAYRFEGRREGMQPLELPGSPRLRCARSANELTLEAVVPAAVPASGVLQLGLSAVTEDRDGSLAWWALRHPSLAPDFHDPESFTLRLDPADTRKTASVTP